MANDFTIYGLRLKGDKEVRYVGQTGKLLGTRLEGHIQAAPRARHNPALAAWLIANDSEVEAFKIGLVDTRQDAFAMERAIAALCLRLEHRLLNMRPVLR